MTAHSPAPRARPSLVARHQIAMGLAPAASEVRRIRQEVATLLRLWRIPAATDTAVLIVSELLTNAVLHAPTTAIEFVATHGDGVLLVEVRDGSSTPPAINPTLDTEVLGSRGLQLVQALSIDWGWIPLAGSAKSTWAVMPVRGAQINP
ncbi:ATP-binding protein [Streptomyces sp. H39-S7]|uniref:ATP-binding protein n=1 Tax=Streptomyces sp. H39-S7 TaxID=3004357 RepID=UPI0022AF150E|nr:ATP-binding protein [Streptomyces sp. H39-S7]MCZ4122661.1 ATP-binding protein [Streptomyces sp. H39-S7]